MISFSAIGREPPEKKLQKNKSPKGAEE